MTSWVSSRVSKRLSRSVISRREGEYTSIMKLTGLMVLLLVFTGCQSAIPNRDPVGEVFPSVVGASLEKERTELPGAFAGEPAILLVGYKQGAQFDLDRWLMGLIDADVSVPIVEIPTIPGLVPTWISGWIDDGMRSGIPREDWASVVTLYGAAAKPVARLTGTESGRRARVIVLDANGTVIWFDDAGYSVRKALAIRALLDDGKGSGA